MAPEGYPGPSPGARAPPPRRAPGVPSPARRLGGWRAALSAVHPAQTGCSLPAPPPPPPSLLPSSSRPAGCLGPPPPRPRPTRCSVETGQTRGRPGRSAAALHGERGQGGRAVHCARPQQPAGRRQGPPGRAPPPEVRHGRPYPRGAQLGRPAPEAAERRPPSFAPPTVWALRAGAAPRPCGAPPARGPPRQLLALRSAPHRRPPPCPGGLRPGALPGLTFSAIGPGRRAGRSSGKTENIFVPASQTPSCHPLTRLLSRFQKGARNYMFLQCFLRALGFCFGSDQEMRRGKRRLKSFRL